MAEMVDEVGPSGWCVPGLDVGIAGEVNADALDEVVLAPDEIEALRLADLEGLYQADAARQMAISRQTFGKIVALARKKVATALIDGKALRLGEPFSALEEVAPLPASAAMLE